MWVEAVAYRTPRNFACQETLLQQSVHVTVANMKEDFGH
jgi:hypothetical protein